MVRSKGESPITLPFYIKARQTREERPPEGALAGIGLGALDTEKVEPLLQDLQVGTQWEFVKVGEARRESVN